MHAIAITDFGVDPALIEVPDPTPGPGEVLVRVQASSVNGFDVMVAAGRLKGMMEYQFPVLLGKDFAGTVVSAGDGTAGDGTAGDAGFTPGDEVFGVVMKPVLHDGGMAGYVTVSSGFGLARIPSGLPHSVAGALGLAGTAASDTVAALTPAAGESVLVAGATGGVGALAVQLLAARGAQVIATARPGQEAGFVRDLGATHTVDYSGDLAGQVRAIAPDGVHAVLHFAGDPALLASLLVSGGKLGSTLGATSEAAGRTDVKVTAVMASPTQETLDRLANDVASGRLRVPITRTYQLADAPAAFADFTAGAIGKLAIAVG